MLGEVHQQDGVAHDDTGQRDEADHRGGGELGIEQHVPGNDADQGQGNRRHDDGRQGKVAELPHHQHVDQDQRHAEGHAHVAEGLVGDGPFAAPLEAGLVVGRRRPDPVALGLDAIGGDIVPDQVLYLEHAVDRRGIPAHRFGGHVFHRTQVLVIDRLVLDLAHEAADLCQRHALAGAGIGHRQLPKARQLAALLERDVEHDEGRLEQGVILDVTDLELAHAHGQGVVDVLDCHAKALGLFAVDLEVPDLVVGLEIIVDIVQARRLLEEGRHVLGELAPGIGIGSVDLGHHRLQHRRARRHLDHLDHGAGRFRQGLEPLAHLDRDLVAGTVTLVLVEQLYLDVALPGLAAQIVVPYQAIEVEGRGGADIGLQIGDLGDVADGLHRLVGEVGRYRQRGALGEVDDDIELGLVVER